MSLTKRRLVDLSVTLENNPYTDPPTLLPKIEYSNHQEGWPEMAAMFPGLEKSQLPGDESWAAERLQMTTHSGTHMDAPWHYASTTDGGKPAYGIDELPLDWCLQPGVKLDFRHLPDGHVVTAAQVEAELTRIGYELKPLDIVLVNTRAGALFGQPGYLDAGVGMGREATFYLLERGVRVVGTDAWSWDAPFKYTRERFAETGDASIIWEGHKAGRDIGYGQMEKLANLESLPASGFLVSCFPYKIKHASAGFVRAVAIFEEWLERLHRPISVVRTTAKTGLVLGHEITGEVIERGCEVWHSPNHWPLACWMGGLARTVLSVSGSLQQALQVIPGLEIDAERMLGNLKRTKGLVLTEPVSIALAQHLGRDAANHLIEQSCRKAVEQGARLREVLGAEPQVSALLSADQQAFNMCSERVEGGLIARVGLQEAAHDEVAVNGAVTIFEIFEEYIVVFGRGTN